MGRELSVASTVSIEYVSGNPTAARIKGMRRNVFGPVVLFVIIFPMIGLISIVYAFLRGKKAHKLLATGIQTTGRLILKSPTNVKVNGRTVYEFSFTFMTLDGQVCTATAKTHVPEEFKDEAAEPLVYNPVDPGHALMLDDLPGSPRISEDGHITCDRPLLALRSLVIPLITILGHGWYLWRLLKF